MTSKINIREVIFLFNLLKACEYYYCGGKVVYLIFQELYIRRKSDRDY